MRAYKVYALESGTVIDHIPAGKAVDVITALNLINENHGIVTAGIHLESKKGKLKDVVKIENRELSKEEVNKIALLAPTATINIIRKHKVHTKYQVELPEVLEGVVSCPNPQCVSNKENLPSKFVLSKRNPMQIRCSYCERIAEGDEITVL